MDDDTAQGRSFGVEEEFVLGDPGTVHTRAQAPVVLAVSSRLSTGSPGWLGDVVRPHEARGDRLQRVVGRYAAFAVDYQLCGCEVRVGVPDRETAVAVVNHGVLDDRRSFRLLRPSPWLPTVEFRVAEARLGVRQAVVRAAGRPPGPRSRRGGRPRCPDGRLGRRAPTRSTVRRSAGVDRHDRRANHDGGTAP